MLRSFTTVKYTTAISPRGQDETSSNTGSSFKLHNVESQSRVYLLRDNWRSGGQYTIIRDVLIPQCHISQIMIPSPCLLLWSCNLPDTSQPLSANWIWYEIGALICMSPTHPLQPTRQWWRLIPGLMLVSEHVQHPWLLFSFFYIGAYP